MTVRVTAAADNKQGAGHAVIRVEGLRVAPDGVRFMIRRPGYREDNLGPTGWQAAESLLAPDAAYVARDVLVLHVGPSVVSQMEPGMNVAFTLAMPDGSIHGGRLSWPAIAGPIGGAGARRGRMVATQRTASEPAALRSGGALVGDVPPPEPPAPPAGPDGSAAALRPGAEAPPAEVAPDGPEPDPGPSDIPEPEEAPDGEGLRRDLRADRDRPAPERSHGSPWGRRVAFVTTVAVLLVAGAAAASVYFARDEICDNASVGPLVDDWGLCPPVVVAEQEATDPEGVPEGAGWNIDPLSWLGPRTGGEQDEAEDAIDRGGNPDEPPSPESQRALARQFLETEPTPEDAYARAGALADEGQVEAAFLIYRYAAERGYADAATAVAAMYDPETYSPQSSPLPRPNPAVARIWYERAAEAGDAEALLSLARLLASQDAVDEARAVLRRADEAGLTDAANRMLEELQ